MRSARAVIVETDGGPEYQGEFHVYVTTVLEAHREVSLPHKSTDREMERACRTGIELTDLPVPEGLAVPLLPDGHEYMFLNGIFLAGVGD